jgi:Holliday junction resolvasome RuvABC DNA-binding subunit
MYVGSDRLEGFQWIRESNIKKGMEFPVSIVNKMPPRTANNFVASISATKIRQAARINNINMVKEGTGLNNQNARKLINEIKATNQIVSGLSQIEIGPNAKKSRKKGGHTRKTRKSKK